MTTEIQEPPFRKAWLEIKIQKSAQFLKEQNDARTKREQWFKDKSPEDQKNYLDSSRTMIPWAASLIHSIYNKNAGYLYDTIGYHPGNPSSMKLFEKETKLKMGSNTASRTAAIRQWCGAEVFDAAMHQRKQNRLEKQQKELEERIKASREWAEKSLSDPNRLMRRGETGKISTRKEFIDDLIADGFTRILREKKGATYRLLLLDQREHFYVFRKSIEMDYITRKIQELETPLEKAA